MTDFDYSQWPPTLEPSELEHLTGLAKTYALAHGLLYLPPGISASQALTPASAIHAPISLFPFPLSASLYAKVQRLQSLYNILYARVTLDVDFLDRVMGAEHGIGRVDDFVGQLWKKWKQLRTEGISQPLHLGIFRSDYLLHSIAQGELALKQVEFNTISSSFGALSQKIADMHRYLQLTTNYFNSSPFLNPSQYPSNTTISGLAKGLSEAHKAYGKSNAVVLFVVQDGERNVFDQRWLEYELLEKHSISVVRRSFDELTDEAVVDPTTKVLALKSTKVEVSVVYYRAGYTPNDYPTATQYDTRYKLESSKAIKCPTIALQLSGAKAIQAALTEPGVLEHYLFDRSDAEKGLVRQSWMGLWSLAIPNGVERALNEHEKTVLKPQREGGGNNVYTTGIPEFVKSLPDQEREAWIGMELIQPPSANGYLVRSDTPNPVRAEVISELGIFGWALFESNSNKEEIQEGEFGWLVRTKGKESNEGGVAAGFSVLDSILLVND